MSRNGQGSGAVPGPSVPGHLRVAPSRRMLLSGCSSSDEVEVSVVWRESRADFFRGVVATSGPLGIGSWRRTVVGETEKLEARSIFYVVRFAVSRYPRGRFLIFSDNLALVLALWKGRSKTW